MARRGTQPSPGARKPRSPFESGLPEGQTPRDDIVGHHFGAKNSMFSTPLYRIVRLESAKAAKLSQVCAWTAFPRGRGPDSGRKVWTKRLLPKSGPLPPLKDNYHPIHNESTTQIFPLTWSK